MVFKIISCIFYFYPRPPRGGRRKAIDDYTMQLIISIHALREEGDVKLTTGQSGSRKFLSTPSARRATPLLVAAQHDGVISIHALREEGDQRHLPFHAVQHDFYPRPPRGGRLRLRFVRCYSWAISIHALREEGDLLSSGGDRQFDTFLSTPSARRATSELIPPGRSPL